MYLASRFTRGLLQSKRGIALAVFVVLVLGVAAAYALIPRQASNPGGPLGAEIAKLEHTVKQYGDTATIRVQLALLYYEAGLTDKATAQLRVALQLDGVHQGALTALGDIYVAQGRYEDAIDPYVKVIELNKDDPMRTISSRLEGVYYNLGLAYFNLGRTQDAIQSLEQALVIDRTDADALHLLGNAYRHAGDLDKAIASFLQAVRFVPDFKEAYQGLADSYQAAGQPYRAAYASAMVSYTQGSAAEAARQLEEVIAVLPDFPEAYLGLGLAYELQGSTDKAIAAYRSAIGLDDHLWLARAKLQALGVA